MRCRLARLSKSEIVLLIIQGFVHQNEIKSSSFVVVCAPTGLNQLYTDLEVKERQVKAAIKKVVCDAIERNWKGLHESVLNRGFCYWDWSLFSANKVPNKNR